MVFDCHSAPVESVGAVACNKRRVLIVSFYFPPYRTIGALRVGKFAKFLVEQGWDVRVLSAVDTASPGMPLEVPENLVTRTRWFKIDDLFSRRALMSKLGDARSVQTANSSSASSKKDWSGSFSRRLHKIFFLFAYWPDRYIGWRHYAVKAGDQIIREWRPDIIFASSPPPTSLLVASALARRHDVPWIAEFRDPWVDNPYYEYPRWRYYLERIWERSVLRNCRGVVSVSPIVHEQFNQKYGKPGVVAMNGFDPNDFPDPSEITPVIEYRLRIVFTGHIYLNYSDPTILFEAIRDLGEEGRQIKVEFYGTSCEAVLPLAERLGVSSSVSAHAAVDYQESLKIQMSADVLLSIQWINEKEISRISAKIFEYMAARRPILAIGYGKGPLTELLESRHAGVVCETSAGILPHLRRWLEQKRGDGVPALPQEVTVGLTRVEQFSNTLRLMEDAIQTKSGDKSTDRQEKTT
ncbi:Glyco_trans_4-like_N domain-containing protein [Azospirillaceae bacterium]